MISKEDYIIKELKKNNQPVLVIDESDIDELIQKIKTQLSVSAVNSLKFVAEEGVEQLRVTINSLYFKPLSDAKKLFHIDSAEVLNTEQINTLLKLLEEPPRHVLIVLSSHNLSAVIPTIRSRCKLYVLSSRKSQYDRELSILNLLHSSFSDYIAKVNSLTKSEFQEAVSAGLEELDKKMLNKDEFELFKNLAVIRNKIQNTNVNYKLLAENLYVKEKINKK